MSSAILNNKHNNMIFFDLETTGLDILSAKIIEFSAVKINNGNRQSLHHIINPGIPIPEESAKIHGIKDDDVKDKPSFSEVATEIDSFLQNEVICGYNIRNYDIPLLNEEFYRIKSEVNFDNHTVVDLYDIWLILEPRTLKGAVKRFCNINADDFHSAENDVKYCIDVFESMKNIFNIDLLTMEEITKPCEPESDIFHYGKLKKNNKQELVLNFGKYAGKTVKEIYDNDKSYLKWLYKEHKDRLLVYCIVKELRKTDNNFVDNIC